MSDASCCSGFLSGCHLRRSTRNSLSDCGQQKVFNSCFRIAMVEIPGNEQTSLTLGAEWKNTTCSTKKRSLKLMTYSSHEYSRKRVCACLLFGCLFVCLLARLLVCLFVCLFVCSFLFVCLFIWGSVPFGWCLGLNINSCRHFVGKYPSWDLLPWYKKQLKACARTGRHSFQSVPTHFCNTFTVVMCCQSTSILMEGRVRNTQKEVKWV